MKRLEHTAGEQNNILKALFCNQRKTWTEATTVGPDKRHIENKESRNNTVKSRARKTKREEIPMLEEFSVEQTKKVKFRKAETGVRSVAWQSTLAKTSCESEHQILTALYKTWCRFCFDIISSMQSAVKSWIRRKTMYVEHSLTVVLLVAHDE